jgi:hypothetical protein
VNLPGGGHRSAVHQNLLLITKFTTMPPPVTECVIIAGSPIKAWLPDSSVNI